MPNTIAIGRTLLVLVLFCFTTAGDRNVQAQDRNDEQALSCTWNPPADQQLPGTGKTVVLISGDEEYRGEEALPMLGKMLSQRLGFTCHALFAIDTETGEINPNEQSNIPGMELLEQADLAIIALRFRNLPDDQMKYFDEFLNAGKPIIALRTSTHAFKYPDDTDSEFAHYGTGSRQWRGGFGKQVLGETWVNHHGDHGRESTRGWTPPEQVDNVLLTGVNDVWGPTDVYGIRELPDDVTILLRGQVLAGMKPDSLPVVGEKNDPMMPLAWTREYETKDGVRVPVFCTTMGAATDFENEGLRRLVVNATLAMTGLKHAIPDVSNVDPVGKYDPADFGFDRFRKGMKPADFQ